MSSETPRVCANNCGFYANKDNKEELCSKCYRELLLKDVHRHIKEATKVEPRSALISSSRLEEGLKGLKIDDSEEKRTSFDETAIEKGKKKKKARCSLCPRVIGLLGFNCKCGKLLCSNHRFPEMHDCHAYDYKANGKEAIAQQNPKFSDDKGLGMHL